MQDTRAGACLRAIQTQKRDGQTERQVDKETERQGGGSIGRGLVGEKVRWLTQRGTERQPAGWPLVSAHLWYIHPSLIDENTRALTPPPPSPAHHRHHHATCLPA